MGSWAGYRRLVLLRTHHGIIGFFLAKKDMDEIAAGRAPYLDESWAKGAYYLNIVALILFVFGFCLLWVWVACIVSEAEGSVPMYGRTDKSLPLAC